MAIKVLFNTISGDERSVNLTSLDVKSCFDIENLDNEVTGFKTQEDLSVTLDSDARWDKDNIFEVFEAMASDRGLSTLVVNVDGEKIETFLDFSAGAFLMVLNEAVQKYEAVYDARHLTGYEALSNKVEALSNTLS